MTAHPVGDAAAAFVGAASAHPLPDEAIAAARMALADWFGCLIGAARHPAAISVRRLADGWRTQGPAPLVGGGTAAPAAAALVNAATSHALDFDDTHLGTDTHMGVAMWPDLLALAAERQASETDVLRAFVIGFEVAARLFGRRFGHALMQIGFMPTPVVGRIAAAAAASVLLRLDAGRAAHALGLAVTEAGGLARSVGTMAKPWQVGKAAMDGLIAAQLAEDGFVAATGLFEGPRGFPAAFVQDGALDLVFPAGTGAWAVTRNSLKPYACLLGLHSAIDAARELAPRVEPSDVAAVTARVAPGVIQVAGNPAPATALEAKFSLPVAVAMGLTGRRGVASDFVDATLADPAVRHLMPLVEQVPVPGMKMIAAELELRLADGRVLSSRIDVARGDSRNPLSWSDLEVKFLDLVEPEIGATRGHALFGVLRDFGRPGTLADAWRLAVPNEAIPPAPA